MKKKKMLFVGAFPKKEFSVFGGIVSDCRVLLNSSLSKKFELILLDTTQVSNPPPMLFVRIVLAIKRFLIFLVLVERKKPDVLLIFASSGASFFEKGLMAWYGRLRNIPALLFPRGGALIEKSQRSRFTRFWVRIIVRGARKFLCQGKAWQDFAVSLCGFDVQDAPIIQNWTATKELIEIGANRVPKFKGQQIALLFIGWLERTKGIFELLESFNNLVISRRGRISLNIVGEGNASKKAREVCHKFGIEDSVNFLGWLHGKDFQDVLKKSDIFVLPSYTEGLPNAMIEAMAAKIAVVVSSVGNIPDVIRNKENGLLIPSRNSSALTEALNILLDNNKMMNAITEKAFIEAYQLFTPEIAAEKIQMVVNSVI